MLLRISDFDLDRFADDNEIVQALNLLGEAAFSGRHMVLAPRQLLSRLSELPELSAMARGYYGWMSGALTQYGNSISSLPYIVVDNSSLIPNKVGAQWVVPLRIFCDGDFLSCVELICESNNDFNVLAKLAEIYMEREHKGLNLRIRSKPGGGNTTADVLNLALQEPNPASVCVVDSDREVVNGAMGETARRCLKLFNDEESWRVRLCVLDARELENLIPNDLVIKVLEDENKDATLASSLSAIHWDIARFGCLKSGESPCRFHEIESTHQGYQATKFALQSTGARCAVFRQCSSSCGECGCQIFPRLGGDFLSRLSDWLANSSNKRRISKAINWPVELVYVLKAIVGMGVALPRRAV